MNFLCWLRRLNDSVHGSAKQWAAPQPVRRPSRTLRLEPLEDRWVLATLIVNTAADVVNPSDGTLSLRDAITAVNAGNANSLTAGEQNQVSGTFGVNDTIEFSAALSGDTITLNGSSALEISANLTITGLGASNLTISGDNQSEVFLVDAGATVNLAGLTLANGSASDGGAIDNNGALTVCNATLSDNSAPGLMQQTGDGGAIYNNGTLTVCNCSLSDNSAAGDGGAIDNNGANVTVSNCILSNNSAANGGAIDNEVGPVGYGGSSSGGTVTVCNSILSDDTATNIFGYGGAIFNGGTMTLTGSTLAGNVSEFFGGAIENRAALTVSHCTLSSNAAPSGSGGGIDNEGGPLLIGNSTFSGNSAAFQGGGLMDNSYPATVCNCTFSDNSCAGVGGAIAIIIPMTVTNCTFSENSAGSGGGAVYSDAGPLQTVSNCTLAGNSTGGDGGGIDSDNGVLALVDSTLSGNTAAGNGGGITTDGYSVILDNTIVADSTAGGDLYTYPGGTFSGAYDLIGDGSYLSSFTNSLQGTPLLAPLGNYGGPTQTMPLLPGSLGIGAGDLAQAGTTDQRGVLRSGSVDIGAVNSDGASLTNLLQNVVSPDYPVAIQINNDADALTAVQALNGLSSQDTGSVTLNLAPGMYSGETVNIPAGMTLYINGQAAANGSQLPTTVDPATPAFTVVSGNVVVSNINFVTTGDAPTILVSGGNLTLQSDNIDQASTSSTAPAIAVTGGTVNLGTATTPGGNTINVSGTGGFISNTTATPIVAVGTTFQMNGLLLVSAMAGKASASTLDFGQALTLTATVTAQTAAPGTPTPTGSVDFYDTTTQTDLGSVNLPTTGSASLTPSVPLPDGSQVITLTYSGDGDFLTSSTTITVDVEPSIYVLNTTASGALSLSGNATIDLPGGLFVDSTSASAVTSSGNSDVTATSIDVAGGVNDSGHASFSVHPVTKAAAASDPLAGLAAPVVAFTPGAVGAVNLSGNESETINPGVYTQISVSGNAKLTLNPGVYVIAGGGFTMSGNAQVSGSGVLIYNAGSNYLGSGNSFGAISISGDAQLNLTAAGTGLYAGIVFFQSRDNTSALTMSGNALEGLNGGVVYAPSALLTISGNDQLQYASLIVNLLQVSGNGLDTDS